MSTRGLLFLAAMSRQRREICDVLCLHGLRSDYFRWARLAAWPTTRSAPRQRRKYRPERMRL
jgi:hypothetical protein